MTGGDDGLVILEAAGTSLVLDARGPAVPAVVHWGGPAGALDVAGLDALAEAVRPGRLGSSPPQPAALTLLPAEADGWLGTPGVAGHRDGAWPHVRLRLDGPVEVHPDPAGGGEIRVAASDRQAGVAVASVLRLEREGVLRIRHAVTNQGPTPWTVTGVLALLPVPDQAGELLDWTGRWGRERYPQRSPFRHGIRSLEVRRGRTGHDATGLLVAGTNGFGFRHGEVWAVHLGWSGNHRHLAQRTPEGASVLGAGELLAPGEVRLEPGETYQTPWAYFGYSDAGLDGLSRRLHGWVRRRPGHPRSPRPVVLNTWEAVYFNQRPEHLYGLAARAAQIGVERFVLDDGWFRGRRDDTAGLGDWYVDEGVWPQGLGPLSDKVRELGMQFGLWVEPEMVNLDSDLARAHPDWLLGAPGRTPREWRHQHTLDVANPAVADYLLGRLDALVGENRVDFLKWDHNRDLLEAVHDRTAAVRAQTLAVYRLIDRLRERHPDLEIESCASGGARADLGILARTDRVWASDTNDPVDRQDIQRALSVLLPPELIGAHVGPPFAHVTGRFADLPMRAATAMFGHAGIEWDISGCDQKELDYLAAWIAEYKRLRQLLHSGEVVRADDNGGAHRLHGVVAADRRHALFCFTTIDTPESVAPGRLRFAGLDPDLRYRVAVLTALTPVRTRYRQPPWLAGGTTLPGATLAGVGVAAPLLYPAQAVLIELRDAGPQRAGKVHLGR